MFLYEQKPKNDVDYEIKLAGLEALVPEEFERHLMLNANRLRTLEEAEHWRENPRLEILLICKS